MGERIDVAAVADAVRDPEHGAVLVFEGVGRRTHQGRTVVGLMYEAWREMAIPEMAKIAAEAADRWPGVRVAIVHRTGPVEIGEPSVVIAVGSPHRAEAYDASRFTIDALKARVPVWKKERYADAPDAWIANRP